MDWYGIDADDHTPAGEYAARIDYERAMHAMDEQIGDANRMDEAAEEAEHAADIVEGLAREAEAEGDEELAARRWARVHEERAAADTYRAEADAIRDRREAA